MPRKPKNASANSEADRKPTITGTVSVKDHYVFHLYLRVHGLKTTEVAGRILSEWVTANLNVDELRQAEYEKIMAADAQPETADAS